MEIRERNIIIELISFILGVFLLIFSIPIVTMIFLYNPSYYFNTSIGYLFLDLLVLAITLLLYAYFLIKPTKTLKGKENLALSAMIFGGMLIILPIIAIGFGANYWFFSGNEIYIIILYVMLLLPGVALFVHGWFLKRPTTLEEKFKS